MKFEFTLEELELIESMYGTETWGRDEEDEAILSKLRDYIAQAKFHSSVTKQTEETSEALNK